MRFAVYDLGSNSVKFLVAEAGGGTLPEIVVEESHATRLAEGLLATATLKPEAMERTVALLRDLAARAAALGVAPGYSRAVATSAVRDAGNRKQFLKAAAAALGFPVLVLSGEEEAEGVYRGICSDAALRDRDLLALDVGGGSAEWILGSGGRIGKRISLPLGCVRLRERFVPAYPLPPEGLQRLLDGVTGQLAPVLGDFRGDREVVATGGTATAAGALDLGLTSFDAAAIHRHPLSLERLEKMIADLAALDLAALEAIPGLPPKRADIIVPGLAVLIATLRLVGAPGLVASVRGLRYGVLDGLIADQA